MHDTFIQAYDTHADQLYRHCVLRVSDPGLAQDLVQDTFLRAWNTVASGEEVHDMRAYLFRVLRNLIIDHYRKKKPEALEPLLDTGWDPLDTDTPSPLRVSETQEILSAIHQLPDPDKEILILRYVDDLEPKDIATALGLSSNVVSVRITRALEKTRKLLHVTLTP